MTEPLRNELKTAGWILAGSLVLTPLLICGFGEVAYPEEFNFQHDYPEIYETLFSLQMGTIFAWLIMLVPVILYEMAVTFFYYWQHPEQLRSVFMFPRRKR